jgi:hypothetical protein
MKLCFVFVVVELKVEGKAEVAVEFIPTYWFSKS